MAWWVSWQGAMVRDSDEMAWDEELSAPDKCVKSGNTVVQVASKWLMP